MSVSLIPVHHGMSGTLMLQPFQIRAATHFDIDAIVQMQRIIHDEHLAWDAARWTTQVSPASAYPEWLRELTTASTQGVVLVAEVDGRAVGYAVAEVEPESPRHWIPRAVYLHDVYLEPTYRGQGIATAMMTRFLHWAAATHPTLQVRLTTAAANEAARRFFAKFGFRACATEMLREPRTPTSDNPLRTK